MSEPRASEIARREEAQAHGGEIVVGSGKRGNPHRMSRMVSTRLDGELVRKLRSVAQQRNTTISELLREGAEVIVQDTYADAVTLTVTKSEGTGSSIQRGQGKGAAVSARPPSTEAQRTTAGRRSQQTTV